jgi:hypothetical protein
MVVVAAVVVEMVVAMAVKEVIMSDGGNYNGRSGWWKRKYRWW